MITTVDRAEQYQTAGQPKSAAHWIELLAHPMVTQRHITVTTRGTTAKEGTVQAVGRHLRNLVRGSNRRTTPFDYLTVGQHVTFVLGADSTQAGRPCAEHVRPYPAPAAP